MTQPSARPRRAARAAATCLAGVVLFACGSDEPAKISAPDASPPSQNDASAEDAPADGAAPPADAAPGVLKCLQDTAFPASLAIAEASAALELETTPGVREVVFFADSGNNGATLGYRAPSGPSRSMALALDAAASDDIEGAAWSQGRLYTLTSSGAVREYAVTGQGFTQLTPAYAIGSAPALSCVDLTDKNCGQNFEGLCLRATPSPRGCLGYAASKQNGTLHCVVADAQGQLSIDGSKPPLSLSLPAESLSDCAYGVAGTPQASTLVVTTNVKNGNVTYLVDETTGARTVLPAAGTSDNEAVAFDASGAIYIIGDTSSQTSPSLRYVCSPVPAK